MEERKEYAPPQGFDVVTRHLVMEKDLNPAGNLYGGAILAWLDEATAIYVQAKIGYTNFVTVNMDDVNFHAPGHRGDVVTVYSRVVKIGKSSVTAETKAYVEEPETDHCHEVITCKVTFVCLKDREKYEYFLTDEYRRWQESHPALSD